MIIGMSSFQLAEFSNKDIIQDLNRLLKMGASGNSATLCKLSSVIKKCIIITEV